jgi:ribosomal subunit interface protein
MDIFIKSKNGAIEPELEEYTTSKVGKLDKFSQRAKSVVVTFTQANSRKKETAFKAEFMLHLPGQALHIHEEAENFRAAVDSGVETLKKQISKLSTKRADKFREAAGTAKVTIHTATNRREAEVLNSAPKVLSESFSAKPLSVSDAIRELELSGRGWLVFVSQSGAVNCLYKRDDSNYGLLEPEVAA